MQAKKVWSKFRAADFKLNWDARAKYRKEALHLFEKAASSGEPKALDAVATAYEFLRHWDLNEANRMAAGVKAAYFRLLTDQTWSKRERD